MSVEMRNQNHNSISVPLDTYTGERSTFLEKIRDRIDDKETTIYADCDNLKSITSSHVGMLWEALSICREKSVEFVLQNVDEAVKDVFTVLDIRDLFIFDTELNKHRESLDTSRISNFFIKDFTSEFIPTVETIVREKYLMAEHLKKSPLYQKLVFELQTIFYEIVTNIRLHADLPPGSKIQYTVSMVNENIVLTIIDQGKEFDITKVDNAYSSSSAIVNKLRNGLGIVMVKRMTDSISYKRKDNNNILTIVKNWSSYKND